MENMWLEIQTEDYLFLCYDARIWNRTVHSARHFVCKPSVGWGAVIDKDIKLSVSDIISMWEVSEKEVKTVIGDYDFFLNGYDKRSPIIEKKPVRYKVISWKHIGTLMEKNEFELDIQVKDLHKIADKECVIVYKFPEIEMVAVQVDGNEYAIPNKFIEEYE
jgi:hypothetical protein